jgi:transposase
LKKDFPVESDDKLAVKMAMLIEGQCTIGVKKAIKKYGYTEQSYYQLLKKYKQEGLQALIDKKRGSEKQPVRTEEITNQIIRMRFLDPLTSTDVLTQKLNQMGYKVSKRSVERTITDNGLQKKLMSTTRKNKSKNNP